jgi:hypothetical protein
MDWVINTWNYALDAARPHPFNLLTLVLALAAIVISIFAWTAARRQAIAADRQAKAAEETLEVQAKVIKSQGEDTRIALSLAERNAAASEESAKAAADSIAHARDSMQRTLRPYVTVQEITATRTVETPTISDVDARKVPTEVEIRVINTGQTPACRLEVKYHVAVLDEIPQSFAEHAQHFRTWVPTDVGRDQIREVYGRFLGKDEILENVARNPSSRFLVYGAVVYQDMSSSAEHRTEFCHVWDVRVEKFFPIGPMNTLT